MKEDIPRRRRFFAWASLLGYDVFISYRRSEASEYAERLHRELRATGLTVFLDRDETPGGEELSPALRRAVRRSRMLVLLLTPEVLQSKWVQDEVRVFSGRRRRSIMPVNIDRFIETHDLTDTALARIPEYSWVNESADALRSGVPSDAVIGQIPKGLSKVRVRTMSRVIVAVVMLALAVTAAFAVVQMREAQAQAAIAIAGQLAAQSELVQAQDSRQVRLAAALGAESMARAPSVQAGRTLQMALESLPILISTFPIEPAGEMAFSPDATSILTTNVGDPMVKRYDLTSQKRGVALDCREWKVCVPDLSSHLMAVAQPNPDSGSVIQVRDLTAGTVTASVTWDRNPAFVRVDPSGRLLLAIDRDSHACLWTVADGQMTGCFDGPASAGWHFNANGRLLAAVIENEDDDEDATDTWHVWDTERLAEVYRTGASPLIMSSTGRYVVALSRSPRFQIRDVQNNSDLPVFQHEEDEHVDGAVFDKEDVFVVTRTTGSVIRLWGLEEGSPTTPVIVTPMDRGTRLVRQTGDRMGLVTMDRSSAPAVSAWRAVQKPRERFVEKVRAYHDHDVYALAMDREANTVATVDANGVARVWDYRNGNVVDLQHSDSDAAWKEDSPATSQASVLRDGGLWTRATRWVSRIWHGNRPSSSPPAAPAGSPAGYPATRIVSPTGTHVALISVSPNGGDPGAVVLYEATSDSEVARIRHTARVNDARFSSDGRFLVSGGMDAAIRIWDVAANRQVSEIQADWAVDRVRFVHQDRYVQAMGEDGFQRTTMVTYRWRAEDLLEAVAARDVRRLSAEEWVPFLGSRRPVFTVRPR